MSNPIEPQAVAVMANGVVNGAHGNDRPHTPSNTDMALTEYSVHPKTPSEEKRARIKKVIPEDYLLPNGYPDVRLTPTYYSDPN
jgi:threonine dehydratase